jgi:hypothetical protein
MGHWESPNQADAIKALDLEVPTASDRSKASSFHERWISAERLVPVLVLVGVQFSVLSDEVR